MVQVPPGPVTGNIVTNDLELDSGTIRVDIPTLTGTPNPVPVGGTNLLAQDDGLVLSQLIAANGTVSGDVSNLTLADLAGNAVTDATLAINEADIAVANAKYSFDLTTGDANDGVYLGYSLTELDLILGQTLHLSPDVGAAASASTLSAKLTGLGGLDLNASNSADQTITLNNSTNNYTGKTSVNAGTVVLGSDHALGQTSELAIASAAAADVNGKTQSIESLSGAGALNINAGDLTVTDGGDFSGTIIGTSGDLNLSGGTLTLTGNNTYTGSTTVSAGTLAIGNGGVSGSYIGDIANNAAVSFNRNDELTYAAEISGTGTVAKEGTGTLVLTGNNTYTGDTTITAGTLQIGAGGTTGSIVSDITNNGSLVFNRSDALSTDSLISGSGSLIQQGSGVLTLTSNNSYTGGTTITSGTLNLANDSAAGTGNIANNSALELSFSDGALSNAITGTGSTVVSGNNVTLSGTNTAYSGNWSITGSANIGSMDHLGSGSVNVAGVLNANPLSGNLNFNNVLTGNGTLAVNMGAASDVFSFTDKAGTGFTGNLQLGQGSFNLVSTNTDALTNATLELNTGSLTTVGAGTQNVGDLKIAGGSLIFNGIVPPGPVTGNIVTNDLELDSGTIRVDIPTLTGTPNPAPIGGTNLLAQSSGLILSQLIEANGTISGNISNLTLADLTGNAVSSDTTLAITESDIAVANAKYGFDLTTGDANDGVYLSYGLTELDLISGQTLHLSPDVGAAASASTFSAKLTGLGGLDLDASNSADQTITLNNSTNNYTGKTSVSAGTVVLGSNHALGQTSELAIASAATADVNGKTQSIESLSGAGTLNINAGDLTVTDGGDFSGTIIGTSGDLNLSGGTLTLTGSNTYTGSTTVSAGTLAIGNGGVSGSYIGDIANNATVSFNRNDELTYAAEISGTGTVAKEGTGTLVLTGNNTYTGDTTITAGTLQIGAGGTTGSIVSDIINNGSLVFNRSDAVSTDSIISGSGSLIQQGSGVLTLTSNNSYTGGTTIASGALNLANDSAAGTGSIANNSALELSFSDGALSNAITGTGSTLVSGNNVTLSGTNTAYSGDWSITGSANIGSMDHLGSGSVNVAGVLNANPVNGNLNFNNVLTGNGTLAVNMGAASDVFSFTDTVGSGFTGTLQLGQSSFELSAINSDALSNATLDLRAGSTTALNEDSSIGNLSFGGGTLNVGMSSPTTAHIVNVDHLNVDVSSSSMPVDVGTINLDVASISSGAITGNFFDQNDVSTSGGIQVVSANTVSSSGKQLNLTLQGVAPEDTTYAGQSDGYGNDDVSTTYSYMAVSTSNSSLPGGAGLYVSYVLKSLETKTNLVLSTEGASNTSLGAQITGVGNVEYRGNSDIITLLNSANDYSGQSLVSSGTLLFGADNVLGNTSGLTIANNAAVNMNGMTQIVGEFTGDQGSLLNVNGGDLTIMTGGNSQGSLAGAGSLTFAGGNMVINGSNAGLSADVTINDGASTQIDHTLGLGNGAIIDEGTLVLTGLNGTLANQISGTGILDVADNSDVILSGANTGYTGTIDINAGSRLTAAQLVNLGNANLLNDGELVLNQSGDETLTNVMTGSGVLTKSGMGTIRIDSNYAHTGGTNVNAGTFILETPNAELSGGGIVSVAEGATLGGYGKIIGSVQNNGILAVADAISGVDNGVGTLFIQGDLVNHNTVKLAGNTVGNTLNISGNYTAASDLVINTVLGGDHSLTDKLIVQGDTSGHTNVTVNNQGGTGAQTDTGIEIVEVGGVSAGTFSLANRVAYGAYDYGLVQTGNNWYLKSKTESGIRAEVGAYLANQTAAKDMFTASLYTRMGESLFATERSAQNHDLSSWVRVGGHVTESRAAGQIDQKIWSSNVQIGTDIANNITDTNRWHLGVMAGSGYASTRSKTDHKAEVARSDVDGYSVGVYGTWFANGKPASTGPYVDSWLQYGWYDNSVKGDGLEKEQSYDSSTLTASIETGWGFKLYENQESQLILQPQVQLTYVHYE